ncbi:conserved Plasmodium protein, unknown function [Plasmodium knowlesi strain H]|uniref:Uncharacterized protein n=3 Tax=Plasmodium knowlesi TaxID=5850 RepID=A0A5K1U0S9_PLAKH|nr:conserved Plasmodium protein, unknown function [Plasmodium knowlesi strain H]OTN65667.1 Uncharacterized protein PKNOH_S110102000 [Plasmodium knowlesi]CAA9989639.1 conserved Plasmodium protein, unknown function [Plasmodium knowlesi strain H]SBO22740.1 conserved Plasmodium protein, unknown function [Plasmodium knowlesi strain H]SBO23171.1 conserved Plasmodium protein, unknown function [Plasmodium knowlesi strain H]VVS79113.1 conserved Plasmodium protein, unknown function [Plasmodium knowlesi |eukprot:XP_002260363.1 hypothetical protein, conserved in Plasmodium species [Plasmodium knowlesi strain H]
MLSLIKSVFSNAQDGKELNVLIIGECASGKTSLFNLISSFHNKSKYDMLNTLVPTENKNGTCALGFNTKNITFNKKPLKIYDLEGTATNTTNIYDCYYDDADVIFYVIDAKDEKHIFNAILYLSCLSSNGRISGGGFHDESTTCKNGRQFLKPIFILGNKSEDTSAFFSAPCISNYINSIDVYKNEKFWQFLLSSDNTFLKHYLGELHEKVRNCTFADGVGGKQSDQKKAKGEVNEDGQNGEIRENAPYEREEENLQKSHFPEDAQKKIYSDVVKDIKMGRKGAITVDDIENDELLETLLKKIVNDNVNNCKHIPIQVYNISVLRNRGVYEVIEKIFDECFLNGMYTNGGKACRNTTSGEIEKRRKYTNEHKSLNGKGESDYPIQDGNRRTRTHLLHVFGEGGGRTGKPSFHSRNCKMHKLEMTEQLHSVPNSAYVMYERNSSSVNLFIEHIQHLHFGKRTFDNLPKELLFLHQGNTNYKKKYKIKKKGQLGENVIAEGLQKEEESEQVEKTYDAEQAYDAEDKYQGKKLQSTGRTLSIDNPPSVGKETPQGKSIEMVREHTKGEVTAIDVNANMEIKREELGRVGEGVLDKRKNEQIDVVSQVGNASEAKATHREDLAVEAIKGVINPNGGETMEEEAKSEGKESWDLFQAEKEESIQDYANIAQDSEYSSKEETPKHESPLCEENNVNGHMGEGKNVIRKGKIKKKRYFIVEKKKKKKFLHSGKKINDFEENSSNSLEGVDLMNVMRIDSLNRI